MRTNRFLSPVLPGVVVAAFLIIPCLQAATVTVPAGSVDALANAIADAGPGGTVIVEPGLHVENETVFITTPLSLLGEPGAVIESPTVQSFAIPTPVDASLHVLGTGDVDIIGLEIRGPAGTFGNTGVVIEDSSDVSVAGNGFYGYQFGLLLQKANDVRVEGNTLVMDPNPDAGSLGITVINGRQAEIHDNDISNGTFGIWACDREGRASGNSTSNALVGIILCRVPQGSFVISGNVVGADASATQWTVRGNQSTGNVWGYMVIDGSQDNTLTDNAASGNLYDIELVGDSFLFGFFTPTSTNSTVHTGKHHDLVIKDCAPGSRILGQSVMVDTTLDLCF